MGSLLLLLCLIANAFGEDINGDIVSYARQPRARAGYFFWYDCSDRSCNECNIISKIPIHFGVCIHAIEAPTDCMEFYQMIHCRQGSVSVSTWTNPHCQGQPELTHDNCYLSNYDANDVNKTCVVISDGRNNYKDEFYRFGCEFAPTWMELTNEAEEADDNVDIYILMG